MNDSHSGEVSMMRGSSIICRSPTTDDVISLMTKMELEDGMKGAPELVLEHAVAGSSGRHRQCDLLLLPAFHVKNPALWIAHFIVARGRGSKLLSSHSPIREEFEVRTCLGTVMKYRVECLLENSSLIHHAIEWFLEHRSMCPDMIWIEYDDAVRDP